MFTFRLIPTYCDRDRQNLEFHHDRATKHPAKFKTYDLAENEAIEVARNRNRAISRRNPNKGVAFQVIPA